MKSVIAILFLVAMQCLVSAAADDDNRFPEVDALPDREGMPDPLMCFDGTRIDNPKAWRDRRRPELKALFQWYMYGAPPEAPQITAHVDTEVAVLDGLARMKQVTIEYHPAGGNRVGKINVLLFVPAKSDRAAPVFLGLNFRGNHQVFDHPDIRLPTIWVPDTPGTKNHRAIESGRGVEAANWAIAEAIRRGYGVATFYHGDIKLDRPAWDDGAPALYYQPGQTKPGDHEWGALAAWAWGLSRAVDYLVTDPNVDPQGLIVFGHSRNGKAALLAGALDERFAIVIASQAGCGGTAPSRSNVGESVERITTKYHYWFDSTFHKFGRQLQKLPFDQHCLMAVVAPRPLLLTNATEDEWANPRGQFEMLKLTEPVYRLLGVEGCGASEMPAENTLIDTRLGFFIRPGKHAMTQVEWLQWIAFADKQRSAH